MTKKLLVFLTVCWLGSLVQQVAAEDLKSAPVPETKDVVSAGVKPAVADEKKVQDNAAKDVAVESAKKTDAMPEKAPEDAATIKQRQLDKAIEAYTAEDYKTAYKLFREYATEDEKAAFAIASMYDNGWGVAANQDEAVAWYKTSANLGSPLAATFLGMKSLQGANNNEADMEEGLSWLLKAAQKGEVTAQSTLGYINYQSKNYEVASYWLFMAAKQGNVPSACYLSKILRGGLSGAKDEKMAAELVKIAEDGSEEKCVDVFKRYGE